MELSGVSGRENRKEKKQKKRKQKEMDPEQDEDILKDDYFSGVPLDILSAIQNICTCFGIGGLYDAKKRKIESKAGLLTPLREEWSPADEIQTLPIGMKQRYAKEMSEDSFKLLGLIKRFSLFFKRLHEGRSYMKDITIDIFLKDVKTKPSLAPPDQYVEIGIWKQIMLVNQKICLKMGLLDKIEEKDSESSAVSKKNSSKKIEENEGGDEAVKNEDTTSSFRNYYMEIATSSFGDDLDRLRQEGSLDSRKVEMLINCLESGMDIWSDLEKRLFHSTET